ncbi:MAG: DNA polymerase III subunit gamma/tau [Patescibacteria group bacterium]|jgi:DNA polymerase-3 subunit gamma/tau|nr:DNA polymerase III subunit gamma/tau [bacterium]HQC49641.1 DNA polymerase III subunit gamma/tau [bacterium]
MSTLYRDYRPQKFAEVLGQKHIKITLQNEIAQQKLAQAFLFCGPRAVGKTTLARVLAKSVNCLNRQDGEYEPCGTCASCLSITAGNNLDVIEIDAASNTGVDNVRENIISFSRLTPSQAKYKVFIIDEVHMLSPSAFNALLKIIEEPPTYVIFILCTTEIHKVPSTIVSRCERFDFKRISVIEIVSKLKKIALQEKVEIDDKVLEAIARRSGGHLRDAESLLGQVFALGDKNITLEQAELIIPSYNNNEAVDLIEALNRKDVVKAISLINFLVDNGINIRNFNSEAINLVRKMIIAKISPELSDNLGLNLGEALELRIHSINALITLDNLVFYARRLLSAYNEKNPLISQLPLELAVIEICTGQSSFDFTSSPKEKINLPNSASSTKVNLAMNKNKDNKNNQVVNQELKSNSPVQKDASNLCLSCAEVREKWPEFLVKIKKHNHSLSFVLQNCEPQAMDSGTLRLMFKYKFHQDRVNDESIKGLIEKTLAEVFGSGISLVSVLDENMEIKKYSSATSESGDVNSSDSSSTATNSVSSQQEMSATEQKVKEKEPNLLNNLLNAFGGEVIN